MSFWSSFRASWRKSAQLRRISERLGSGSEVTDLLSLNVSNLLNNDTTTRAAENELYDLVQNDPILSEILRRHGATRAELEEIYRILCNMGAAVWIKGHWVAASSLCFGHTLDFAR
jgi:hypothetical protein